MSSFTRGGEWRERGREGGHKRRKVSQHLYLSILKGYVWKYFIFSSDKMTQIYVVYFQRCS